MQISTTYMSFCVLSSLCSLENDFSKSASLTGEVTSINNKEVFKLKCQSVKKPILQSVEFFVDHITAETVRHTDGKCYNSKRECNSSTCMCSKDGRVFTWIFHSSNMLGPHAFGCQARILNDKNSTFKTTATLTFDGSEFVKQQSTHENVVINSVVEIKSSDGNESDSTAIVAVVCIIVVCIIAAATVSFIIFCYKKRNGTNEQFTDQPLLGVVTYNPSQPELVLPHLERSNSQNAHTSSQRECTKLTMSTSTSTTEIALTCGEDFPPTSNIEQCEDGLQKNEKLYELNLKKEHDLNSNETCTVDSMIITGDNHVLIVDIENNYIKFLDEENVWHNITKSELIRVTPLYKNVIAAIFSNEEKIRYIQISSDKIKYTGKEIDLKTLGKPLNIVYNKDHFAVRFGLGLKGRFVILNTEGNILHIISNSKKRFGDFNENSVEVALSLNERCIFISSFDKNTVYCVNFDGQTLWSTPVACPKGILYVSNTAFLRQRNIILACQSPNVIYQIDSISGKLTLLIEEKDGINVTKCVGYTETETEYLLYTDSNTGKIFEFSLTAKNL